MGPKKVPVRLMVPFNIQCFACEQYIYKNTKFNARKSSTNENYLGVSVYQFSMRCSKCSGEIIFKTDPKHGSYKIVKGAHEFDKIGENFNGGPNYNLGQSQNSKIGDFVKTEENQQIDIEKSKVDPLQYHQHLPGEHYTPLNRQTGSSPSVHTDRIYFGGVQKSLPEPKRRKKSAMKELK